MVNQNYQPGDAAHNIIIEGREKLSVTGVTEVLSFDEEEVMIVTVKGLLCVCGQEMHVEKLSLDVGEINIEGLIDSVTYEGEAKSRGSFWSKIF